MAHAHRTSTAAARAFIAALVVTVAVAACPAAQATATTPKGIVTAIYRYHFAHKQRWDLTFKRYRTMFSKDLLAAFDDNDKRQAASPDEVVGLDGDPLTDSQEMCDGYTVTGSAVDGANTVVSVDVRIEKEHRTVRVRFIKDGAAWKIDNILYAEGDLVTILRNG